MADGSLLNEVQRDALDANVPLADTLRKLVALGGVTGSTELREWATLELRGYVGEDTPLPKYRKPAAILEVDALKGNYQITGQQVSPRILPSVVQQHIGEEVPLTNSVGELEAMRQQAEASGAIKLSLPKGQDIVTLMNAESREPFQHIVSVYWAMSAPSLAGVLDAIRTTLVELIAEMRAGTPVSADVPSPEVVDHAVNLVIHGQGARTINVNTAAAVGSGAHQVRAEGMVVDAPMVEAAWPELREQLAGMGIPEENLEELHAALLADGDPVNGELGPATNSWLGWLSQKIASGTITLAGATGTEFITHAILHALGLA
jgi:hypothetical protein